MMFMFWTFLLSAAIQIIAENYEGAGLAIGTALIIFLLFKE